MSTMTNKEFIAIENYIASNNQGEAMLLLKKMGASKPKDANDLVSKLHIATQKFGDKAFEELAKIDTPYRRLILSTVGESKSNCSGCGGKCSESTLGVAGHYDLANFPPQDGGDYAVPQTPVVTPVYEKTIIEQSKNFFKLHPMATGVVATVLGFVVIVGVVKLVK